MLKQGQDDLSNDIMMIKVNKDELIGDYITIKRHDHHNRDSIIIKIVEGEQYTLGELVITEKMRVFYNHKKRG